MYFFPCRHAGIIYHNSDHKRISKRGIFMYINNTKTQDTSQISENTWWFTTNTKGITEESQ